MTQFDEQIDEAKRLTALSRWTQRDDFEQEARAERMYAMQEEQDREDRWSGFFISALAFALAAIFVVGPMT
ncbi:MAG: hypothetical protein ACR2PR_08840 [Pseudohongiellaceae bacterium]